MAGLELKSADWLKEIMKRAQERESSLPIAWVTAVFPVELVRAFGFHPYYPENFGALAAARKVTGVLGRAAENQGYFADLCGYARAGLGDCHLDEHPVGKIMRPDIILGANNQCTTLAHWFEAQAGYFGVPYFLLDVPAVFGPPSTLGKRYVTEQLMELADFLETYSPNVLSPDRLAEVVNLSNQACRLWGGILAMATLSPAPFSFFDACVHMAPIVTLRGTREAVEYYSLLLAELEELAGAGRAVVPGERFKLYWDHIPVWPRLRWFAEFFASRGALVAVSQYTHSWVYRFDEKKPLESLAEEYAVPFVNRDFGERLGLKLKLMKEYQTSGFILLSNRSCKATSIGLYDKCRELTERTGLPGVVLEADMADPAFFNEKQVTQQLEVFFARLG